MVKTIEKTNNPYVAASVFIVIWVVVVSAGDLGRILKGLLREAYPYSISRDSSTDGLFILTTLFIPVVLSWMIACFSVLKRTIKREKNFNNSAATVFVLINLIYAALICVGAFFAYGFIGFIFRF